MAIRHVFPPAVRRHPMYTPVVTVPGGHELHYFAGACAVDNNGEVVGEGDMTAQFRYVMRRLTDRLDAIGATWTDVVFRRIFTTDVDACLKAERDEEVLGYLDPENKPGSSLIGVTRLANPKFLIEVELVVATESPADAQ